MQTLESAYLSHRFDTKRCLPINFETIQSRKEWCSSRLQKNAAAAKIWSKGSSLKDLQSHMREQVFNGILEHLAASVLAKDLGQCLQNEQASLFVRFCLAYASFLLGVASWNNRHTETFLHLSHLFHGDCILHVYGSLILPKHSYLFLSIAQRGRLHDLIFLQYCIHHRLPKSMLLRCDAHFLVCKDNCRSHFVRRVEIGLPVFQVEPLSWLSCKTQKAEL